jgi:oligoendopeptidase F
MSTENGALPHWDLGSLYGGLEADDFVADFAEVKTAVSTLTALFDQHGINRAENLVVDADTAALFEELVAQINTVLETLTLVQVFLYGHITTDSRNNLAQAKFNEMQPLLAQVSLLSTRLTAWLGSLDIDALLEQSEIARENRYMLEKARKGALHLMSPQQEDLASELQLTGGNSWERMFSNYTSQLQVKIELDGEEKSVPLTAAQNLAFNPDRDVRRRAHEGMRATLQEAAVPLAAALNSIKGETITLSHRRGWDSPLEMVLFDNALDVDSLQAMMDASEASFPDFQRYLKARAQALGLPKLAAYDRLVPLGTGAQSWSYSEANKFIVTQFGTFSEKLESMAKRAFVENWIDAEPRDGKSGGAFCMPSKDGQSLILENFEPGFTSVSTLAHELGHAYHNLNLAERSPLQRSTPMTLAETASTFCQKIVENAALQTAGPVDQKIIIDGLLEYATRVVLGASGNFFFEQSLFEKRRQRELSVDELCELDKAAQLRVYGDALDPDTIFEYRWAYIPHFYAMSYYNFQYIFGLLFGLWLYAEYQKSPDVFVAGYDELLSLTGMENAADLATRFGIDLRDAAFWNGSLDVLRADIDRFIALVE